ncbi:MAG: diguanylate cyclase [Lachnospiraceae bacterium]|jgi:diguanylate cyclase (GGDEF)-like protein|nr:diguanylate cyclase [Lachnospiraceae bacterium]RKJ49362.1 GGDEF domain-containing protein [bacterium 1XD42-54]
MVNKKQTYQDDFRMHLKSLSVFLLFMLASFLTFFCLIQKDVTENTEAIIINNVDRQSIHFTDTITLHFEYLEGIASHFAASDDLLSENNLQLLESVKEQSSLELLAVITPDGTSTYSNGMQKSVASRRYFQEAIAGHRALSAPIISKVDNKTTRIILAVPICRGDNVIGVIGGSCDVSSLSKMLFGDIYDGAGSILILNSEGEIISCTMEKDNSGVQPEDNFFRYYSATKFREGVTLETIRQDFSQFHEGLVLFEKDNSTYYMAYRPLKLSDWSLCYIVPVSIAQQSYQFVLDYELILFGTLFVATLLLLFVIFRSNNKKQQELIVFGQTDALTGILNKKSSEDQINDWLADERCIGYQVFMMLDIDGFKNINDIQGHIAGDEILRELGTLLRQEFRETDIVGRIGGDEFCILAKNNTVEHTAALRADRLCQSIRCHKFSAIPSGNITISVGVAISPIHGRSYQELYVAADKALYETKRNGKDGYTVLRDVS